MGRAVPRVPAVVVAVRTERRAQGPTAATADLVHGLALTLAPPVGLLLVGRWQLMRRVLHDGRRLVAPP